jgi:hypothetical protein
MFQGLYPFSESDRQLLTDWLRPSWTSEAEGYIHVRIEEDRNKRDIVRPLLQKYLCEAHRDAREFFERAHGHSLDPRINAALESAYGLYPAFVERLSLAGMFGELLAGLVAEVHGPFSKQWFVPVFCFRYHDSIFRELLRAAATGSAPRRAIGRLGDDCLAFTFDGRPAICMVLVCEAKCTHDHDRALITRGLQQLSETSVLQLEFLKIIQILKERRRQGDESWATEIMTFRDSILGQDKTRSDMLVYAHGRRPARASTWIDPRVKDAAHSSSADLAAAEVYIEDISDFIETIYAETFTS